MARFLLVCLAGALGTGTRYLVWLWSSKALGTAFPYGTLFVNLAGCFLLAAVMQVAVATTLVPPTLRFALTGGFLGGLTTYSAFNFETTKLIQERAYAVAALNFGVTTLGCFLAGLLGVVVAARVVGS